MKKRDLGYVQTEDGKLHKVHHTDDLLGPSELKVERSEGTIYTKELRQLQADERLDIDDLLAKLRDSRNWPPPFSIFVYILDHFDPSVPAAKQGRPPLSKDEKAKRAQQDKAIRRMYKELLADGVGKKEARERLEAAFKELDFTRRLDEIIWPSKKSPD